MDPLHGYLLWKSPVREKYEIGSLEEMKNRHITCNDTQCSFRLIENAENVEVLRVDWTECRE